MPHKRTHWGEWVSARSGHIGFRRQIDLAVAIGCSEDQLSRWINMELPPRHMRRGYDQKLAAALKIEPAMLFSGYAATAPAEASSLESIASNQTTSDEEQLRRKVHALAELLPLDGLREVHERGRVLLGRGVAQVA